MVRFFSLAIEPSINAFIDARDKACIMLGRPPGYSAPLSPQGNSEFKRAVINRYRLTDYRTVSLLVTQIKSLNSANVSSAKALEAKGHGKKTPRGFVLFNSLRFVCRLAY